MAETATETMCYVARKPCGCVVAAVVIRGDRKKLAKIVAAWIEDDLDIDRVDREYVRENWVGDDCPHRNRQLSLIQH